MSPKSLSDEDKVAILQCMKAIAESQLIEDWELQTRLGLNREDLRAVISRWPNIDDSVTNSDAFLAINNCMNEICNGVYVPPEEWNKWFTMTKSEILKSYHKWARQRGNNSTGLR